ncbi:MAG: hypothetical protein MI923_05885 [Phycisphaerales bacterium]|nr:hypothetical protein [Phycisphaerales bacterium]
MVKNRLQGREIKWSYATHVLEDAPRNEHELQGRLKDDRDPPCANDVIVAEVVEIGRHKRIGTASLRRCHLLSGDLVGVAYGNRYATRQYEGRVPDSFGPCHLIGGGGVCGEVVGMAGDMNTPTVLRPLGYLRNGKGERLNLQEHGLRPLPEPTVKPKVILVVGSAMDSGKTTVAASIIHGLSRSGSVVCAGKLTGTAASKDLLLMKDSGAVHVLDFTNAGHSSTAQCSQEELWNIFLTITSHLAVPGPDYIVLEIADGITQRETELLLELHLAHHFADIAIYACNDSLGVRMGLRLLRKYDLNTVAVSGCVACSPLATREAQELTHIPVLPHEQLSEPNFVSSLMNERVDDRVRLAV